MAFFNAKVIIFEGADGCGKTTQIKLLKKFLEKKNLKVYCTREPGGSPSAEKIRKLFLSNEELDIWTQILLCSAARNEHLIYLEELQKKDKYDVIIFDRFIDSTLAYQIYPHELSPRLLFAINREISLNVQSDCSFILDIDPEITVARRKKISDHFDSNIEFLKKVREAYLDIQNKDKRKILINSNFYPRIVHNQIVKHVLNILPQIRNNKVFEKKLENNDNKAIGKDFRSNKRRNSNFHKKTKENVENKEDKSQTRGESNFF